MRQNFNIKIFCNLLEIRIKLNKIYNYDTHSLLKTFEASISMILQESYVILALKQP